MFSNIEDFGRAFDVACSQELDLFFQNVPGATHLTDSTTTLNNAYYIRHRIETIKRIRATAEIDALALAGLIQSRYDLAQKWDEYAVEELGHDRLYLSDLRSHGVTLNEVDECPIFRSTQRLIDLLRGELTRIGPLAAVAYSLFVEFNSERYSAAVVEKAARQFGANRVKGSRQHCEIDSTHDHYGEILNLTFALVVTPEDAANFNELIGKIAHLFRAYFRELFEATITSKETQK